MAMTDGGYIGGEKTPWRPTLIIREQTKNGLELGKSDAQKGVHTKDIKLTKSTRFGD